MINTSNLGYNKYIVQQLYNSGGVMNYLAELENSLKSLEEINKNQIEAVRRQLNTVLRHYHPGDFNQMEDLVRTARVAIKIDYDVEYDVNYLSGYLLGVEDYSNALRMSTDDFQYIALFDDDFLMNTFRILFEKETVSSNELANLLDKDKSTVSRKMSENKYKEYRLFNVLKVGQKKYYSLSPHGKKIFNLYQNKQNQVNELKAVTGLDDDDVRNFHEILIPSKDHMRFSKSYVSLREKSSYVYFDAKHKTKKVDLSLELIDEVANG